MSFFNANVKVQCHSTGVKELGPYGDITLGSALYENHKKQVLKENSFATQLEIDNKINKQKQSIVNEAVIRHGMFEDILFENINMLSKTGKDQVFKHIIFEHFYSSLVLDEEFKAQSANSLKAYSDSYIDKRGGFALLQEACKKNPKNLLLKNMKESCEKTNRKVCASKTKQAKESSDTSMLVFDLTEDEREELRYNADLGIDQVSEIVRDKVKNVIVGERDRQSEEEEILSELEAAEEAVTVHNNIIEETTVFNALMRNVYKEYLTEKAKCGYAKENDYIGDSDSELDVDIDELEDAVVDMDVILSEAITQYTMLELMNTICLENFGVNDLRKISHDLLHK